MLTLGDHRPADAGDSRRTCSSRAPTFGWNAPILDAIDELVAPGPVVDENDRGLRPWWLEADAARPQALTLEEAPPSPCRNGSGTFVLVLTVRRRTGEGRRSMAKYLLLYSGGRMPETEAEQATVMKAWDSWFHEIGSALADGREPVHPVQQEDLE